MKKSITTLAGLLMVMLLGCTTLGILSFVPEQELQSRFLGLFATFETSARITLIIAGIVSALGLVAGFAFGFYWLYHKTQQTALDSDMKRILIKRQALVFEAHPVNYQVFQRDLIRDVTSPLHLEPGPTNGKTEPEPREDRLARWQKYQIAHATMKLPGSVLNQLEAPEQPRILSPILPLLVEAQRLIIAGGSDSGKTTLIKHMIAGRADHSLVIPIDPHAPSKILGYNVIGAGRDYGAICEALESLILLMDSRYEDVKAGLFGYGEHERVSIFVDEWTSICENIDSAGKMLKALLTESRKVNIHLTICSHSTTVEALGIDAQIRKSAIVVELVGDKLTPRRAFVHPNSKTTAEGKKAVPQEFALPGPFAGYVEPKGQVIRALPDAKVLKAQILAGQGFSMTAIAKEFYQTDKPNSRQISEIKDLLEQATIERQAHDN